MQRNIEHMLTNLVHYYSSTVNLNYQAGLSYRWFRRCLPPIDLICLKPLHCWSAYMFWIVLLHKSVSCGIFVLDKRQQERRKDVLIGDAIHVALKNTDVHRPLSRNSGPDMNLCIKHIACELYWLQVADNLKCVPVVLKSSWVIQSQPLINTKLRKRNYGELDNNKFKRNYYTTIFFL